MELNEFEKLLEQYEQDELTSEIIYDLCVKFKSLPLSERGDYTWENLNERFGNFKSTGENLRCWVKSRQYEDGTIVGKAGTPIRVTIPANEHFTINGQYSKKADGDVELLDYYIHGCQFTNLDVTETWVTTNRDGNVEIVQIDPIEDYYLELN